MENVQASKKIKVLIVDDSAVVRQTLQEILLSDPALDVMGTAPDPIIAADKMLHEIPDVILLDIEMPRMDGLTFLKKIMTQHPIPVVICSSHSETGSENAFKAIEYGAVEIINKPKIGTKQFLEESQVFICDAVKAAYLTKLKKYHSRTGLFIPSKYTADVILPKPRNNLTLETTEKIIVVGASTGGTEALKEFLIQISADAPGIVIVQHMPEHFTTAFAKRLDSLCKMSVKEAEDNDTVIRGRALIAPGNKHILLRRSDARYYTEIKTGPLVSRRRPSVDVLFRSAARYVGKNAIGIIMTGMGDDGARECSK